MERYVRFVVRHRLAVLAVVGLLTLLALANMSRAVIASSIGRMFFGEAHAGWRAYIEHIQRFASDGVVVVAWPEPAALAPANLDRLARVVERLEAHPDLRRVRSVLSAQRVRAEGDDLVVERYADVARARPEQVPALVSELATDPLAGGLFVSADGRHTAVLVEARPVEDHPAETLPDLLETILGAFLAEGFEREALNVAGPIAVMAEITSESRRNVTTLMPAVVLALFLVGLVLFRRLWPVALTLAVAGIGVVWTVSFAVLLEPRLDIMISVVPPLLIVISFADVIHLCSGYLVELDAGDDQTEAIVRCGREVGFACLLTSATTFIGFASMSFVPTPMFRQLGLVMGFGVGAVLLLAMTLAPVAFALLPPPRPLPGADRSRVQAALDAVTRGAQRLARRAPWRVVAGSALLVALSVVGLSRLEIDASFVGRFQADNPIARGDRYVGEHFAGANLVDFTVRAAEDDGALDPALVGALRAWQAEQRRRPAVARVVSLVDVLDRAHRVLSGDAAGDPPNERAALAQLLLLLEVSGAEDLATFVDHDRRTLRIAAQVEIPELRRVGALAAAARDDLQARLPQGATVSATGVYYLLGDWLDEILAGQRQGLGFAVLSITLMMILGLRSLRVGLWSMVPNLLPLICMGGAMGLVLRPVDSDALIIAVIALGIGVDDTIHFLVHMRRAHQRGAGPDQALDHAFRYAGRPIVISSVVLCVGFAPLVAGSYLTVRMMGFLLPPTLLVALAADLLLVPALVRLGAIRFASPATAGAGAARPPARAA